ncbi:splicing factor PRP40 family [Diplonema papillatum]|nr:splicing factor PRP40 family [Diplonema papillatum]
MKMLSLAVVVFVSILATGVAKEYREEDLEHGQVYYFNTVTGDSAWERPDEMGHVSTEEDHDGATFWVVDGESTWEIPAELDWRESYDETEKKPFYYNPQEGSFTWEKPACLGWIVVDASTNSEL